MRLVALASAVVMAAAMDMPPRARKQPMRAPAGTHHKQAHSIGRQPAGACGAGLALVHIGKAGGSSVSANLRMGCHAWWAERYGHGHCPHENRTIQNESELSMQVVAYWHVHTVPVERYARFVVMVRNPIERIISIYLMQHPGPTLPGTGARHQQRTSTWGSLFYVCFPTVNAFAESLPSGNARSLEQIGNSAAINSSCATLGWETIRGADSRAGHFYWNYQAYAKPILDWNAGRRQLSSEAASDPANVSSCSAKPIYVIRTEELWHDFNTVNVLIGADSSKTADATPDTHLRDGNSRSALASAGLYNRTISRIGLYKLCLALTEEIAVYEELLHLAVNLEDHERDTDYERVRSECPGHRSLFAAAPERGWATQVLSKSTKAQRDALQAQLQDFSADSLTADAAHAWT